MTHEPAPRVLRHTPGTIEALAQNAAHRFASQHALVHYGSGAVFSFIPKNACTSLRVSLAMANGAIAELSDWTWVHHNNATFSATLPDLARAPATAVILRCPYRRLASTFLDKIVSRSGELWTLHRRSRDMIDPERLTFRSFVDWIAKPAFLRADVHWRPQADFLVYRAYDKVFGMEDLRGFAACFEATTGQPFVDARPLSGHSTSAFDAAGAVNHADTPLSELSRSKSDGQLPSPAALYDEQLIARVGQIYAQDLVIYRELVGMSGLLFPEFAKGAAS